MDNKKLLQNNRQNNKFDTTVLTEEVLVELLRKEGNQVQLSEEILTRILQQIPPKKTPKTHWFSPFFIKQPPFFFMRIAVPSFIALLLIVGGSYSYTEKNNTKQNSPATKFIQDSAINNIDDIVESYSQEQTEENSLVADTDSDSVGATTDTASPSR